MMARKRPSRRLRRNAGIGLAAAAAVAALGLAGPAHANLSGSTFEGNDGNLIVNTAGDTDWVNAPNRVTGVDQPSGSSDNAFGQGTKEDNPAVTVVDGSIPPNKSDLTRFYVGSEFTSGSNFLYLAWERSNVLGTANMDFEINQKTTTGLTGTFTGPITINRTAGDVLITFDFTNGGGNPQLGLLRWVTTGAASQCFSANAVPCWGNRVDLSAAGFAEGAVNAGTVTDPIANTSLAGLTFGEAAVNLTAAHVFPSGTCEAFGSAFVKSRSSASFTAEVKDFIAPQPVDISNCGTITIHKVTQNGNASFGYTTTGSLTPSTFNLSGGGTQTYGPGTVLPGSYSVTESTMPTGWSFVSLVCTASGSGTSVTPNSATAAITMAPGGLVDCTYTNHTNFSPTVSTTLSTSTANIGDPVTDSATLTGATANAGGTVTYTVYSDNACTQSVASGGTKTVSSGVVPDSDPVTFSTAGTYYWQAAYSGDSNNSAASSPCTSEQLLVKTNPSVTTSLSASTVNIGASVSDSATLSGATSDAGGTVTYTVYTNSACTQGAQSAGVKTVTNGLVPNSDAITFNNAGTFYWQAAYSGDAKNNSAVSPCASEQLVVSPNNPAISTAQDLLPNDSATLTGATATAGGTFTFSLFAPSAPTCSGTPAYTQPVSVNGNGTYSTTNTTFHVTDPGTWRWLVVYSGDGNNTGTTSACGVENFTITNN